MVEYICINNRSITLFIILKGEKVLSSWILTAALDLDWHFGASQKGWTSSELGFKELVHIFDLIKRKKFQNRIWFLICDGHNSYFSVKFIVYYIEHDICLFLLLPHSSYLLQLLNVGCFGPLKMAVSIDLDQLIRVGINQPEKVKWVKSYIEARPKAFTQKNIHAGWCHSELAPTNPYKHILL